MGRKCTRAHSPFSPARHATAPVHFRSFPRSRHVNTSLDDTLALMRDLRKRCDWDAAQTHESLRPYLVEEAHEVDDAIRSGDDRKLREELGDLLLQVLFHAVLAEERGAFDAADVADTFITKMKGRHPHLYGDGMRQ